MPGPPLHWRVIFPVGRSLVSVKEILWLSGSGEIDSVMVAVGTAIAGVSTGVVTVVPTGWIPASVGLVHPAKSAQSRSAQQAAAGIRNLMIIPFSL
jgi:hypothetical protein